MAFGSLRLRPGVQVEATPALNEAGVSASQLIRFRDGLIEKLGGWTKYYGYPSSGKIRHLHAWQDLTKVGRLAIAAEQSLVSASSTTTGVTITPQRTTSSIAVALSTVNGSPTVTVTDNASNMTTNDVVVFQTPVSVGGLIIFGAYAVASSISANQYTITATDLVQGSPTYGQPKNATSTVVSGGAVPSFATTNGSFEVTVTLNNHGLTTPGQIVAFPVSTTGGGVTIYGTYSVITVPGANTFTIYVSNSASSTTTFSMNAGNAYLDRWIAVGPGAAGSGYGIGGYGSGGYGTGSPTPGHTGTPITATDWDLDNWGSYLLAQPAQGPCFWWDPVGGFQTMRIITNGPMIGTGMFVAMPQRQIVVYGAELGGYQDPLLVRWCDVDDFSNWIASTTNQAGSYRIPRGSGIISGIQTSQQALLWTDLALWSMQYLDGLLVWGFNEIGAGCGIISKKARAALGGTVYWMGRSQFFRYSGSGVEPVDCSVWDVIFQDLDTDNASKIRMGANSMFNEIVVYYPSLSGGTGENDKYVKLKATTGEWDYGTLAGTAWIDQNVLGQPFGAGTDGFTYQHESGRNSDINAMTSWFETGWLMLNEGEQFTFVDWLLPDFKWGLYNGSQDADMLITVSWVEYPQDAPKSAGPFTVTQLTQAITDIQFRARMVKFRIESQDINSFWRIGNVRYQYAPDGTW